MAPKNPKRKLGAGDAESSGVAVLSTELLSQMNIILHSFTELENKVKCLVDSQNELKDAFQDCKNSINELLLKRLVAEPADVTTSIVAAATTTAGTAAASSAAAPGTRQSKSLTKPKAKPQPPKLKNQAKSELAADKDVHVSNFICDHVLKLIPTKRDKNKFSSPHDAAAPAGALAGATGQDSESGQSGTHNNVYFGHSGRNRQYADCRVCAKMQPKRRIYTRWYCEQCHVPLCSDKKINETPEGTRYVCYQIFHTKDMNVP